MIRIFGIGPGSQEWLPPIVQKSIQGCDVIMGSERALALFSHLSLKTLTMTGNLSQSILDIKHLLAQGNEIGVLVSGDPGFYSLLPLIRREFPQEEVQVYPGISSLQLAFAKAGIPWQDALLRSVHGRELETLPLNLDKPLFLLTGGENTPQRVAQYLLDNGRNVQVSVGNALGYPEEFWEDLSVEELAKFPGELSNAVLIVYPENDKEAIGNDAQGSLPYGKFRIGIPDTEFLRGNVPMTKAEIRVQVLAKAEIQPEDRVLDVGAGTGSISIEAANFAFRGKVYAVEKNPEAIELIKTNKKKFQVEHLEVIEGKAPEVFENLPQVEVCIIGGSQGKLKEILTQVPLIPGGRVVMTAITLENAVFGLNTLKELGYQDIRAVSIQAVRWNEVSHLHMAEALNPVIIIQARKAN